MSRKRHCHRNYPKMSTSKLVIGICQKYVFGLPHIPMKERTPFLKDLILLMSMFIFLCMYNMSMQVSVGDRR